jgi:hypothetical protein
MDVRQEAREVLDFWFGSPGSPEVGLARKEWFRKDPAFDDLIRRRFASLHARLEAGESVGWEDVADALLARVIVLDQFSRNMFRDTPRAYASDAIALAGARTMVARGWDMGLLPVQRMFVYLPYEHSEQLADQDECVALMQRVAEDARLADMPEWAEKHRVVVARFGRFPHRNAILGRASTPEEVEFLRLPGSSF